MGRDKDSGMSNELPLFPLNQVLHSDGRMQLRVFETRYMDMVKQCLRDETPFGVCLIADGEEVLQRPGAMATPHEVGVLARIVDWEMPHLGILDITVQGGDRFRILSRRCRDDGLQLAQTRLLPAPTQPLPAALNRLASMLRALLDALENSPPKPHRFLDAAWVADRWAEILPMPLSERQHLLELDNGVERLLVIQRFLDEGDIPPDLSDDLSDNPDD